MERPRIKKVEGKQQQWLLHTARDISNMVLMVCCQLGGARLQHVQVHFVHHLRDSFKISNWSTKFFDSDGFVKMPEPAVPWLWNIYKSIIGDYWQNQIPAPTLVNILMCPWDRNWVGAGLPWMYSKDGNHRSTCLFPFIAIPHFVFESSKEPQRTLSEYELEYAPPKLHHRMYAEHTHSSSNEHWGRLFLFFPPILWYWIFGEFFQKLAKLVEFTSEKIKSQLIHYLHFLRCIFGSVLHGYIPVLGRYWNVKPRYHLNYHLKPLWISKLW